MYSNICLFSLLLQSQAKLTVKADNVRVANSLVISGYQVTVRIMPKFNSSKEYQVDLR